METLRTILSITEIVDVAFAGFVLAFVANAYRKSLGVRRTTCPLAQRPAVLELDPMRAALAACIGGEVTRISRCSLRDHGQLCNGECLADGIPTVDHVGASLPAWYEGQPCARCGKTLHRLRARFDRPALVGNDGVSHEWCDLVWRDPNAPAGYKPVCRGCHIDQLERLSTQVS